MMKHLVIGVNVFKIEIIFVKDEIQNSVFETII